MRREFGTKDDSSPTPAAGRPVSVGTPSDNRPSPNYGVKKNNFLSAGRLNSTADTGRQGYPMRPPILVP